MFKDFDYDSYAKYYDDCELDVDQINEPNLFLYKIFKEKNINSVLDLTCGTGVQAIYLKKKGFDVVASDLSKNMIDIAKSKAKSENLDINFYQKNMIDANLGKFDAVITIFNAIAHLKKNDFKKTLKNIYKNLNKDGIYIFDIFNLKYFYENFREHEFIDRAVELDDLTLVRFNKNSLNIKTGVLRINQKLYIQEYNQKPKIKKYSWDMQIYSYEQLKKILEQNKFKILNVYSGLDQKFDSENSVSIYVVAQKI